MSNIEIYQQMLILRQKINSLVKKYVPTVEYYFENGNSIICSPEHLIFEDGVCKKINESTYVDTINGQLKLIGAHFLGNDWVYDVSIPYPHIYVTPNGIKHHNTTIAKIILNMLGVTKSDILDINASRESGVETIRTKIVNFCSTWSIGEFKVVFLDEADRLSLDAQQIMRAEPIIRKRLFRLCILDFNLLLLINWIKIRLWNE
jgi:DNA polymerase III delta prime subunit